jgi:hypothetical protein
MISNATMNEGKDASRWINNNNFGISVQVPFSYKSISGRVFFPNKTFFSEKLTKIGENLHNLKKIAKIDKNWRNSRK